MPKCYKLLNYVFNKPGQLSFEATIKIAEDNMGKVEHEILIT